MPTFNQNADQLSWQVLGALKAAIDSSSYKGYVDEQTPVGFAIPSVARKFHALNISAPRALDSVQSLNEDIAKLKPGLANDNETLRRLRDHIIRRCSSWDLFLAGIGISMPDSFEVDKQIAILETIQPVIEGVGYFVGHPLWVLRLLGNNLEYLIENTQRLKPGVAYNH